MIGFSIEPIFLVIFLPLGISYYTLQLIGYNIDVYRGKLPGVKNFLNFALYVAFFPKLLSGPIERSYNFIPQISKKKELKNVNMNEAFFLTLFGLFKKIVIADYIGHYIDKFYLDPSDFSSMEAKLIIILYTIQLYADFTAYSDIARGLAKFLGFDLMINFNQPYLSTNPQQLWRRWHISLSSWLWEYIYKPLGGDKKGKFRLYLNIMIVFVVCGIWHGVGWGFIIWGFIMGSYMVLYRLGSGFFLNYKKNHNMNLTPDGKLASHPKLYKFLGWFALMQIFTFSVIFIRSPTVGTALEVIKYAYFRNSDYSEIWTNIYFHILIFTATIMYSFDFLQMKMKKHDISSNLHWILRGMLFLIMIYMILIFSNLFIEYKPFIYEGY